MALSMSEPSSLASMSCWRAEMEFTLAFAASTGVLFMWLAIRATPTVTGVVDDMFGELLGGAVFGLVAGRLAAMALAGTNPIGHPSDILLVRGGVDTGAAALAAVAALAWMSRRRLLPSLDAEAAPILFGLAGWHLGCVWRSACLGTATELPWAMSEPGSEIGRHPTEIYTGVLLFLAAWLVRRLWKRGARVSGVVASLGLAAASLARLATEPLRPALGSGATGWYVAGSVIGLVGLIVLQWRERHRPSSQEL